MGINSNVAKPSSSLPTIVGNVNVKKSGFFSSFGNFFQFVAIGALVVVSSLMGLTIFKLIRDVRLLQRDLMFYTTNATMKQRHQSVIAAEPIKMSHLPPFSKPDDIVELPIVSPKMEVEPTPLTFDVVIDENISSDEKMIQPDEEQKQENELISVEDEVLNAVVNDVVEDENNQVNIVPPPSSADIVDTIEKPTTQSTVVKQSNGSKKTKSSSSKSNK